MPVCVIALKRTNVGSFTFQEAFDRTGRILNIVVTPMNSSDPPRLLNYLTAPHVLVWSAAVASSSLPGVFEANRLVVKEADGWERYESGGSGQAFSDGSMEQDLPMEQLSEMFNVNHFIISQANPHAVMFASYNNKSSVWSNPLTGVLGTIVTFLRDQIRAWVMHMVECMGARRLVPLFETQRGFGSTFFTQEYEGRSIDISLIPWLGHRGLFSALLHIIYNPSEAEFREWIDAASRETWRHIPAIKSHIAEEVTLDRCVQRLRKRLLHESWEKRTRQNKNHSVEFKMGDRVPSFFNSPSLVNLGGQSISDQTNIEGLHLPQRPKSPVRVVDPVSASASATDVNHKSGWGGLGLRGNRSSGNLTRTTSEGSGLFIEDDHPSARQDAGEDTINTVKKTGPVPLRENEPSENEPEYIKTSSMARFYYRKNPSFGTVSELVSRGSIPGTLMGAPETGLYRSQSERPHDHRQRSKSHGTLDTPTSGL